MNDEEFTKVVKIAKECGAAEFYPETQSIKEQNYLVSANFLQKFAEKLLQSYQQSHHGS